MSLLVALLLACSGEKTYYEPPVDTEDTAGGDTGGGRGGVPAALAFTDYSAPSSAVWWAPESDGTRLYALRTDRMHAFVSGDLGATWDPLPDVLGLAIGGGRSHAVTETGFVTLDEDGSALDAFGFPAGLTRADIAAWMADGTGTLWVTSSGSPKRLWRLPPDGEWIEADVGTPSHLWLCRSAGPFAVVRDFTDALRWDDAGFARVGTVTDVGDCFSTAEGTVLVLEGYGPYQQARFPIEGTVERAPVPAYGVYAGQGDAILRSGSGFVERSEDDGVTWTSRATWNEALIAYGVVAVGEHLAALGFGLGYEQAFLGMGEGAAGWSVASGMGFPPFVRAVDLAIAEDGRIAMLCDENIDVRLYVQDAAGAWHMGPLFSQGEARAVAIRPEGDLVFVGGTGGRYVLLDHDGTQVRERGGIASEFGEVDTNAITSASWSRAFMTDVITVGTADDGDTEGNLWFWTSPAEHVRWVKVTPESTTASIGMRPGGYHAVSTSSNPTGGPRVLALHRSWYATNGWLSNVLSTTSLDAGGSAVWQESDPLWAGAPLTSMVVPDSAMEFFLWTDGRLDGRADWASPFVQVEGVPREASVARLDPAGRLWIAAYGVLSHTDTSLSGR